MPTAPHPSLGQWRGVRGALIAGLMLALGFLGLQRAGEFAPGSSTTVVRGAAPCAQLQGAPAKRSVSRAHHLAPLDDFLCPEPVATLAPGARGWRRALVPSAALLIDAREARPRGRGPPAVI